MTSAAPRLSRVSAAAAIAFALAAAPAGAAGYLKLGDIKGEAQARSGLGGPIMIESWSFGASQPVSHSDLGSWSKAQGLEVNMGQSAGAKGGNVEYEWKVEEGESAPPRPARPTDVTLKRGTIAGGDPDRPLIAGRVPNAGVEREMKESGEKGGTEDINIGVGELQEMTISKSMDRSAPAAAQRPAMTWDNTKHKKWSGRAAPLPRQGSVSALVPAGTCRLGARYPSAELGTGQRVYRMTNVVVTGCQAASGGGIPTETLSLNYDKIVWR